MMVTCVAGTPPSVTVAPAAKFDPVMVTGVPPTVVPLAGLIAVTRGAVEEGPVDPPSPHAAATNKTETSTRPTRKGEDTSTFAVILFYQAEHENQSVLHALRVLRRNARI
jgi:hypothetical protein